MLGSSAHCNGRFVLGVLLLVAGAIFSEVAAFSLVVAGAVLGEVAMSLG